MSDRHAKALRLSARLYQAYATTLKHFSVCLLINNIELMFEKLDKFTLFQNCAFITNDMLWWLNWFPVINLFHAFNQWHDIITHYCKIWPKNWQRENMYFDWTLIKDGNYSCNCHKCIEDKWWKAHIKFHVHTCSNMEWLWRAMTCSLVHSLITDAGESIKSWLGKWCASMYKWLGQLAYRWRCVHKYKVKERCLRCTWFRTQEEAEAVLVESHPLFEENELM